MSYKFIITINQPDVTYKITIGGPTFDISNIPHNIKLQDIYFYINITDEHNDILRFNPIITSFIEFITKQPHPNLKILYDEYVEAKLPLVQLNSPSPELNESYRRKIIEYLNEKYTLFLSITEIDKIIKEAESTIEISKHLSGDNSSEFFDQIILINTNINRLIKLTEEYIGNIKKNENIHEPKETIDELKKKIEELKKITNGPTLYHPPRREPLLGEELVQQGFMRVENQADGNCASQAINQAVTNTPNYTDWQVHKNIICDEYNKLKLDGNFVEVNTVAFELPQHIQELTVKYQKIYKNFIQSFVDSFLKDHPDDYDRVATSLEINRFLEVKRVNNTYLDIYDIYSYSLITLESFLILQLNADGTKGYYFLSPTERRYTDLSPDEKKAVKILIYENAGKNRAGEKNHFVALIRSDPNAVYDITDCKSISLLKKYLKYKQKYLKYKQKYLKLKNKLNL